MQRHPIAACQTISRLIVFTLAMQAVRGESSPVIEVDPLGLGATDVWLSNSTLLTNPNTSPAYLWASNHAFRVGRAGWGDLMIAGGAQAEHNGVLIADEGGSAGRVFVQDHGTLWSPGANLSVGSRGEGHLEITAGAEAIVNANIFIAGGETSSGVVLVDGAGSKLSVIRRAAQQSIYVGNNGDGTLLVSDTASVESGIVKVGGLAGARINLTDNASLEATVGMEVGGSSQFAGQLRVDGGSVLSSGYGKVYGIAAETAMATARVEGAGSMWNVADRLAVGSDGLGSLGVGLGGTAKSVAGDIGGTSRSYVGQVEVTGIGSGWNVEEQLTMYNGDLEVSAGASVNSQSAIIGTDGTSRAKVTGEGSSWRIGQQLTLGGYAGSGTLELGAGGIVEVGSGLKFAKDSLANGTLRFLIDRDGISSTPSTGQLVVGDPDIFGSGALTIDDRSAELSLEAGPDANLSVGDTFRLVDYEAISGVFSVDIGGNLEPIADEAAWLTPEGYAFRIDYDADLDGAGDLGITVAVVGVQPTLPGDFNADGRVDAVDYTVWRDSVGQYDETAISWAGDGLNGVDHADRELWVANFGRSIEAVTKIPEPVSVALSIFAGAVLLTSQIHSRS